MEQSKDLGHDPFNQNFRKFWSKTQWIGSVQLEKFRKNGSTSKGGPVFSKLFQLDRTDPLSFGPKFPEILVEWIVPKIFALFHAQVLSREAPPKVEPLTFLYTIFGRKCILPYDKWYPFHIPNLEISIPFNGCRCTVLKIWINSEKPERFRNYFTALKFYTSVSLFGPFTGRNDQFLTLSYTFLTLLWENKMHP